MAATAEETQLLTEHLTYPPLALIDDIINRTNEVLNSCIDALDTGLSSADPSLLGFPALYADQNRVPPVDPETGAPVYEEARMEIEEGVHKLETLMENAVDKNFDRLELWTLRNVLCLPREKGEEDGGVERWVRLGHYENLQIPSQSTPQDLTPSSLQTLRRTLSETTKLHAALTAEASRNAAQIQALRSLLQPVISKREPRSSTSPIKPKLAGENGEAPFAFLTHTPAAKDLGITPLPLSTNSNTSANPTTETNTPLTTHTTFTQTHLPYLRTLLSSLTPHLRSTATALPSSLTSNTEEMARERKAYVESQSRRVLERRGVDTREGVGGVVEGVRVGREEVAGLESLVGGLGGGKRRGGDTEKRVEMEMDVDEGEKGEGEGMDLS